MQDYLLEIKSNDISISLELRDKITTIKGDTATGKSYLYKKIEDANIDGILPIDYKSVKNKERYKGVLELIKNTKGKIIIIDQVDDIQRVYPELMSIIDNDASNRYILLGRNPKVLYRASNIAEMDISDKIIRIKYSFDKSLV